MKPSAISEALRVLVAARQPVFIWSSPGAGKSAIVHQLAEALNVRLQDVRALLLDPVDLRGLPFRGATAGRSGQPRSFSRRTERASSSWTS
jgi:MoxR-like ATPase